MELYGPDRGDYAPRRDKGVKRPAGDAGLSEAAWLRKRTKAIHQALPSHLESVRDEPPVKDRLANVDVEDRSWGWVSRLK